MDIKALIDSLNRLDVSKTEAVSLYFVEKRKKGLTAFAPELGEKVRGELTEMFISTLSTSVFELEQSELNLNGRIEDTLETSDLSLGRADQIINEISENPPQQDMGEMKLEDIKFYLIEFRIDNESQEPVSIKILKRFYNYKKLRKGLRGYFTGNHFQQFENDIIGIDCDIDLVILDDEMLVINRASLNSIFDMNDYYLENTKAILADIGTYSKINNFEQFSKECLEDRSLVKRFTQLQKDKTAVAGFFEHYANLPSVIEQASLEIKLDSAGNIDYQGEYVERLDIFKCMADRFYKTLLQGVIGEDALR
ncbi:Kiwa anti-phage protein KwaB-like domain-containing protein [Listeria booriae]|uniref:Kiwa anti-phage protein KwaB-like domain-containing protein n=1 Tax=Listeria booriae TaxID=1552123 RepID=UPI001629C7E4|nr:Kiwa anti-phage protein KwaB-like domain-containing protein [Listeria booriae]MBC1512219.1 DUF4868 domain-containing protein [Listeria booriae]MBC6150647.1 DUF4868 domain-containing protein [Listeria booriae]MBC6305162.1 DUF4868 domain-containing protein [Listeria booriae]